MRDKKSKIRTTGTKSDGDYAPSMKSAAAQLGCHLSLVRMLAAGGSKAFSSGNGRIHLPTLRRDLELKQSELKKNSPNLSKEQADVLLKVEQIEKHKLQNAALRGEMIPAKDIARRLLALSEEAKAILQSKLVDQLPALNEGLSADKQRVNNREACEQICRRFQEFAEQWT